MIGEGEVGATTQRRGVILGNGSKKVGKHITFQQGSCSYYSTQFKAFSFKNSRPTQQFKATDPLSSHWI